MAEQADGSIVVDTELDTKGFKAGSSELHSAIKSLGKKVEALGPIFQKGISGNASAIANFNGKAATLESTIQKIEAEMESLGNTQVPTDDFVWLTREIEKAENELNKLYDREAKMEGTGVKKNSQAWRNLQYDISLAKRKIDEYTYDLEELKASGQAFNMGSATPEYAALGNDLAAAKARLAEMRAEAEKANGSTDKFSKTVKILGQALSGIWKVGKKAFSGIANVVKKAASRMKLFNKHTNRASFSMNSFSGRMRMMIMMIKQMLVMRAFMGIITAIGDGFKNLAQYSDKTNAELSALKSGLTQLKNSFATAFAPILTVVTPTLVKFINLLSRAVNYIGQLFAALSGSTTYIRAKEVQEDFAASLEGTANAAKKAKNSLSSFDDLNVITNNKDTDTGEASPEDMFEEVPIESKITDFIGRLKAVFENGDYDGIGEAIGNGINKAFQKLKDIISWDSVGGTITSFVGNVAEGFNSLVDTVDWGAIGDTFSQGFNAVVNTLHLIITEFNWQGVATGFAEGLNGFVTGVDWAKAGQTLSDGFLGALNFIHTALETFDWQALGTAVADFIANIDWSALFSTILSIIGDIFTGVLEFRQALHEGLPPELEAVLTLVEDIGLAIAAWKISSALLDGINSIVALPTAVTVGVTLAITGITLETKGLADAVQSELDGMNFAEIIGGGLLTTGGIAVFSAALMDWLTKSFAVFGSPKVAFALAAIGKNLGLGTSTAVAGALGAAFAGIIAGIPAYFVGIYDAIKNGIDWLSSLLIGAGATAAGAGIGAIIGACGGPIGAGVGALIGLAVGLITDGIILLVQYWDEIAAWFDKVGAAIGDFFTKTIPNAFTSFIDWLGSAWDAITNWFAGIPEKAKEFGYTLGHALGTAVKWAIDFVTVQIPEFFTNLWNTVWGALTTFFTQILPDFFSAIFEALKTFFTVTLPKFFTETIPKAFTAVIDFFKALPEKIWNAVKSGWNWLVNIGKNIIDGIWEGLQTIWSAITNFVSGFVQGFKDALGIHSPSTVFAEIGGFLIQGLLQGITEIWHIITDFFTNAFEGIKNLIGNAWSAIKQGASTAWSAITNTVSTAWNGIKSGVSTACTAVSNTVSTAWNGIKSGASTAWNSVKSTVTSAWSGIKSTVSSAASNVKSVVSSAWNNVKSTTSTVCSNIKSTVSSAWSNIKSNVSSTLNNIKSSASTAWNNVKSTVSSVCNNIKSTVSSSWNSAKTSITNAVSNIKTNVSNAFTNLKSSASTWGKDVCENMANGISKAKSTVENAVKGVADKIKSFLGFSEPEDGPLSNFHTYMPDMLDLMAKGIRDNEGVAISAVSDLAGAISDEVRSGDSQFTIGTQTTATSEIEGFLTAFADKVTDSFANLVSRLQAIANGVTFAVPAMAGGAVIPYRTVCAESKRFDNESVDILEELQALRDSMDQKLNNIVEAIEVKETGITEAEIYRSVKKSVRTEEKSTGRSPF